MSDIIYIIIIFLGCAIYEGAHSHHCDGALVLAFNPGRQTLWACIDEKPMSEAVEK